MEELKYEQVGVLVGGNWEKCYDINRRVYSDNGLSPTITTMGGGQREPKIIEPIAYDEQNGYLRQDGCVGTLQDGSSPKHNNRVVEPIIYDDYNGRVRADQDTIGTLTTNCWNDAPRNGVKIIEPNLTEDYRIRKLTERECFRLMGVKSEDFERVAKNQSTSSLYHLAGDSIVTTCLMAIFGKLFGIDYESKINDLVNELKQ